MKVPKICIYVDTGGFITIDYRYFDPTSEQCGVGSDVIDMSLLPKNGDRLVPENS